MPDGGRWPRISIVVASLNYAAYIEEMIRSALLQGYPDLELVLIDGASDGETLGVISKYARWFSYWISEPDNGQSQAFNKGLARMTGDIFNIFDSDDFFVPGSFGLVAQAHTRNPKNILAGDVIRTWERSAKSEVHFPAELDLHAYAQWWSTRHHGQPGIFYPSSHFAEVGWINENLHCLMDYEYTLRYLAVTGISVTRCAVAVIRHHSESKSSKIGDNFVWECIQISKAYQRMFPDIDATANRHAAGILFGFGFRRLLRGQGNSWRFMREGLWIQPFWAFYWLSPGWLIRKWAKLTAH